MRSRIMLMDDVAYLAIPVAKQATYQSFRKRYLRRGVKRFPQMSEAKKTSLAKKSQRECLVVAMHNAGANSDNSSPCCLYFDVRT